MENNTIQNDKITYYEEAGREPKSLTDQEIDENFRFLEGRDIKGVSSKENQLVITLHNNTELSVDLNKVIIQNKQSSNNSIDISDTNDFKTFGDIIPFSETQSFKIEQNVGGWKKGDIIQSTDKLSDIITKIFKVVYDVELLKGSEIICDIKILNNDEESKNIDITEQVDYKIVPNAVNDSLVYTRPEVSEEWGEEHPEWMKDDLALKYKMEYSFESHDDRYEIINKKDLTPESVKPKNYFVSDVEKYMDAEGNEKTRVILQPFFTDEGEYKLTLNCDYSAENKPVLPDGEDIPVEEKQDEIQTLSIVLEEPIQKEYIEDIVKSDNSQSLSVVKNGTFSKEFIFRVGQPYFYKFFNDESIKMDLNSLINIMNKKENNMGVCAGDNSVINIDKPVDEKEHLLTMYIPEKYSKLTLNDKECVPVYTFNNDNNMCVNKSITTSPDNTSKNEYKIYILDIKDMEYIKIELNNIHPPVPEPPIFKNEETI